MSNKSICSLAVTLLLLSACQTAEKAAWVDQKCLHKYGLEVQPDYWVDCGRNGQLITTHRDGTVITQSFANGMLNGECTYTFPHTDQNAKVEVYFNDALVSHVIYNVSGVPVSSLVHESPEIWTETVWYDSGHPKSIEKFERNLLINGEYFDLKNKRDAWVCNGIGDRLNRDDFGFIISTDSFRGGELEQRIIHYPNGTPEEVVPFSNGLINGMRKTYHPGGEPRSIETWNDGLQNGLTMIFQNGEKYAEVPYLAGKKNGIERRYRDGTILTQEITWNNDQMHGPSYTYVGDLMQTDWFYNGRMSTRSNFESFAIPKRG